MVISNNYITTHYAELSKKYRTMRSVYKKPLTLAEKILFSHLYAQDTDINTLKRGRAHSYFKPDRVIMQDATAQMAMLQLMQSGRVDVAIPSSVHCDHLIVAKRSALLDLKNARATNKEIYDFLLTTSQKYGLDFWEPGAGIIHQVTLENYALPGMMIIGTDSHTPNAAGLSCVAIGVGGADAVDAMVGMPWELLMPKLIGVYLTGKLSPWCSPKDIILKLTGELTVKGGTGYIIEYFGDGVASLSCTGRATIGNMGAEVGATSSIFPADEAIFNYLELTSRELASTLAREHQEMLSPDTEVLKHPRDFYDIVIEIDLNVLEPHINGPYTPDRATPLSQFAEFVKEEQYPTKVSAALIGSCTNSSYEDLSRVHSLLTQSQEKHLELKSPFWLSPGSESIYKIIENNGFLKLFETFGTHVLANACGPCIGQWHRTDIESNEKNSIITSFNRNFAKRADGNPNTHSFVTSPEIVTAFGLAGSLLFNPLTDPLINKEGTKVFLAPPKSSAAPSKKLLTLIFGNKPKGLTTPPNAEQRHSYTVTINATSDRLQVLTPFSAWDGDDFSQLHLLIKAKGKCTTDHISMAGPWLQYRGHLENISQNLLIGAVNAFNDKTNSVLNQATGAYTSVPEAAATYRDIGVGSIIVGDENYGEGSSREHAAMEPRFMGVKAVLAKSFARIHETNLKKQGILPLIFIDASDFDTIKEHDRIDVKKVQQLSPGSQLEIHVHHQDKSADVFNVSHTMNAAQIKWFLEGSALNVIKKQLQ